MTGSKTKRTDGGTRKRAAIYARISFDRTGERLGVERQIEACEELAERHGWLVVKHYVDNSVSATSGVVRPAYREMLAEGEAGDFDVLIGWDSDRIVRLLDEGLPLMRLAASGAFEIATVNAGTIDLSSAGGRLQFTLLTAVAQMEIEHKRERQALADEQRRALGRQKWAARPFGYERDGTPHEVEGPIVVDMIRRYLTGESLTSIVRDLNERGVTTTGGKPWLVQTVRSIILSPRNAGLYPDEQAGSWAALVDHETYRSAKVLARRRGPREGSAYLLSGSVVCGRCGRNMVGNITKTHGRRYICPVSRDNGQHGCGLGANAERVHEVVEPKVLAVLADPAQRKRIVVAGNDGGDASETLDRIAKATDARAEIVSLVRDRVLTATEARPDLEGLADEIEVLRGRLSRLGSSSALLELPTDADALAAFWRDDLDVVKRSAIIAELFRVTIGPSATRGRIFDADRVTVTPKF
jgi:DNA invertase Pin-like site-specific DNA recombinase